MAVDTGTEFRWNWDETVYHRYNNGEIETERKIEKQEW